MSRLLCTIKSTFEEVSEFADRCKYSEWAVLGTYDYD